MHLTNAELARLELMFAAAEVRSDPPTLSATDRMMDAMIHSARTKATARRERRGSAQPPPDDPDPRRAGTVSPAVADSQAADQSGRERTVPSTLAELIEIRRALLRSEPPSSGRS